VISETTPDATPRLLVSVRSAAEVGSAVCGGADIIDVKDPHAGSLGRAAPRVLNAVAETLRQQAAATPLSAALGELCDWTGDPPALPSAVRWVKLGLAGCAQDTTWRTRWQTIRQQVMEAHPQVGWIAVAYADHTLAGAPEPREVLQAAIETRCAGVLIDTFTKRDRRLFDWMPPPVLAEWLNLARRHEILTAVAGSLHRDDLHWLRPLRPGIVAIRGAACPAGQRTAEIDATEVERFRQALRSV
jgi:uncharacterized protein (UPF0264 family)